MSIQQVTPFVQVSPWGRTRFAGQPGLAGHVERTHATDSERVHYPFDLVVDDPWFPRDGVFRRIPPLGIYAQDNDEAVNAKQEYNKSLNLVKFAKLGDYEQDGKRYHVTIDKQGRKVVQVTDLYYLMGDQGAKVAADGNGAKPNLFWGGPTTTTYTLDRQGNLQIHTDRNHIMGGSSETTNFRRGWDGSLSRWHSKAAWGDAFPADYDPRKESLDSFLHVGSHGGTWGWTAQKGWRYNPPKETYPWWWNYLRAPYKSPGGQENFVATA